MKTINEIIKALRCTSLPRPDCDCDFAQIAIDAADLLEKIQRNMESNINFLKRKAEEAEENAKEETDPGLRGYYNGRADAFYAALALVENTQEKLNAALKECEQE